MRPIVFELCAETIAACFAARDGGAHRIELCSALSEGGLTPSHGLVAEAVERTGLPIHVMLRPRGGDFVYSPDELRILERDLLHMQSLGVGGVVLGLLHPDHTVDIGRTSRLVQLAAPLPVTFHRAFDEVPDLSQALEDVIQTGCDRILTSGGQPDVEAGALSLVRLVTQAAGRIKIALGGGLRLENATAVARATGASHFHGSVRRFFPAADPAALLLEGPESESIPAPKLYVDSRDVRSMIENLNRP